MFASTIGHLLMIGEFIFTTGLVIHILLSSLAVYKACSSSLGRLLRNASHLLAVILMAAGFLGSMIKPPPSEECPDTPSNFTPDRDGIEFLQREVRELAKISPGISQVHGTYHVDVDALFAVRVAVSSACADLKIATMQDWLQKLEMVEDVMALGDDCRSFKSHSAESAGPLLQHLASIEASAKRELDHRVGSQSAGQISVASLGNIVDQCAAAISTINELQVSSKADDVCTGAIPRIDAISKHVRTGDQGTVLADVAKLQCSPKVVV
ncbi:uncharacterized protein RCC_02277 [Ramularia collo-cygni]|uniref:Uncharacterized protein n=1 Tax=Ramularia collo-cygni TaxID=112498 RepID=A0A2D3V1U3_9PEZI|nr:uncharacterized protein RCC_02277 [Ramularia collo-cygni]CZT16434.1 uncharacterized protein RCC_02277 [Ramularia collo-cygni]